MHDTYDYNGITIWQIRFVVLYDTSLYYLYYLYLSRTIVSFSLSYCFVFVLLSLLYYTFYCLSVVLIDCQHSNKVVPEDVRMATERI